MPLSAHGSWSSPSRSVAQARLSGVGSQCQGRDLGKNVDCKLNPETLQLEPLGGTSPHPTKFCSYGAGLETGAGALAANPPNKDNQQIRLTGRTTRHRGMCSERSQCPPSAHKSKGLGNQGPPTCDSASAARVKAFLPPRPSCACPTSSQSRGLHNVDRSRRLT